jgi:hypothetical protein
MPPLARYNFGTAKWCTRASLLTGGTRDNNTIHIIKRPAATNKIFFINDMALFSDIPSSLLRIGKRRFHIPVAAVLVILFFHNVILFNKTLFFRDIHRWFYPMKYFLASSFKNGSIPLWCSNYFCGSPFIGDLQSGVFYPLSLIFLFGPANTAFNLYILIHIFLGFIFLYFFIKELGLSSKTAFFAGIAYCFSGCLLSSVNTLNNLSAQIWLPAILWSATKAITKKNKSAYFLTIIFSCMSILGGEPQLYLMSITLLIFYCLFYFNHQNGIKYRANIFTLIIIMVISSILITFVQLGPAFMDYQLSVRSGGISYEEAARHSLYPLFLKHLLIPLKFSSDYVLSNDSLNQLLITHKNFPWLLTIYPGFLILPLALFGLITGYSKKLLFWLVIFLLTLILAMGKYTPVYYLFYKLVPLFRFPEKFMFLASFSLIIISAYGLEKFIRLIKRKPVSHIVFYILLITLIIDLYYNHKYLNPSIDPGVFKITHEDLKPVIEDRDIFRIYTDQESISPDPSSISIYKHQLMWQMMLFPNLGILNDIYHVDGTTGLELRYQYIITEILQKPWEDKIDFLKMANVKYVISSRDLSEIHALRNKIEKMNTHVYRIKDFLPRAWITGKLQPIRKGTLDELVKPDFDYVKSAITKSGLTGEYNTPYFKEVSEIKYSNDRIEITVDSEEPGILILTESSYPGWKVFVDGKGKKCLWLNLLFQGVEIEEGKHRVEFIYKPEYFHLFIAISLTSTFLFFLIWFYSWLSAKKNFINNKS